MEETKRSMTQREREAGLGKWPAFQPHREVRCPDCDWFMQWGDGEEDRTSYFRQSHYEPAWKYSGDYHIDCEAGKDSCPRCRKAKVVYTRIVNRGIEERVGHTVEFTGIDGKQCFGKITDVVIRGLHKPQLEGLIVDVVHHREIEV